MEPYLNFKLLAKSLRGRQFVEMKAFFEVPLREQRVAIAYIERHCD